MQSRVAHDGKVRPMNGLVEGKCSVVTGGAQGIGLAIGRRLAQNGARVVLVDIDPARAEAAATQLSGETGAEVLGLGCDVTSESAVHAAAAETVERFGGLDIWVNNAGVTRDASLRKMSVADFETVMNVHLKGTWLGVRHASAIMREAGGGAIVNMSSLSGNPGTPARPTTAQRRPASSA